MKRTAVFFLVIFFCAYSSAHAAKVRDDVVVMKNGDRLTCKVKKLDRGRLKVETNYMSTVFIDWTHVAGVRANRTFEVEAESGATFFGEIDTADEPKVLAVRTADGVRKIPIAEVVYATEIKSGFFQRIDGNIDLGFNFQKSSRSFNYSIGAEANYRTEKRSQFDVGYNSILSRREDSPRAFRNVFNLSYTQNLKHRWYALGFGQLEQNDELALDLRTNLGGGVGRYILQNNRTILSAVGGLTTNRERYVTQPEAQQSLEAFAGIKHDFFIHGDLGADITTSLTVFPSLTEGGRYRAELRFRYKHEIVTDFVIALSGWYSYDSKAPAGSAETVSQDDYGVVTSLGWEF